MKRFLPLILISTQAIAGNPLWIPSGASDVAPVFAGSIVIPSIALSGGVCTVSATGKFGSVVAASANGASTVVQRDASGNATFNHVIAGSVYDSSNNLRVDLSGHALYDNSAIKSLDFASRQGFDNNGATSYVWDSVNGVSVYAGLNYHTTASQPSCTSTTRGLSWLILGGAGVADIFQICQQTALSTYVWMTH